VGKLYFPGKGICEWGIVGNVGLKKMEGLIRKSVEGGMAFI
jgi:hypothetical protein